ncbi:MAG: hypothetical protein LBT13_02635 [Treponema sp.]|nr:hypothetical protein [Treponema sp.]
MLKFDENDNPLITQEEIATKVVWFNEQINVVKDQLIRCIEELGYPVTVTEHPVMIKEGLTGDYQSRKFHILIHGYKSFRPNMELCLKPFAIWLSGNEGALSIAQVGDFPTNYIIHFSLDDIAYTGYQGADEEGWYWDNQEIKEPVYKLTPDTVKRLLGTVA